MGYSLVYSVLGVIGFLFGHKYESLEKLLVSLIKIMFVSYVAGNFADNYVQEFHGQSPGVKVCVINYDVKRGIKGMVAAFFYPLTVLKNRLKF